MTINPHARNVFLEFITQEFLGRFHRHASSHVSSAIRAEGVALMNGFLREERLNSRVTVVPEIPFRDRRSDFAYCAQSDEQRALELNRLHSRLDSKTAFFYYFR